MRRKECLFLFLAGLALALAAAGCGGPAAVTAPGEASVSVRGAAVLQGAVVGAGFSGSSASAGVHALAGGGGFSVSVVGTALSAEVDEDGRFVLAGVPAGTVNLRFEGPGVNAQVSVSGLVDGQVTSITVQLSGSGAQVSGSPTCSPTAETFFSGTLDQVAGAQLVVSRRTVDASHVLKVWRGERRIQLSDLQVGEKVKVWGTLRGDGVVVAEEIAALTSSSGSGQETWVTFKGKVAGVVALATADVRRACLLKMTVAGRAVQTDGSTVFKWSDGSDLDPYAIVAGDQAYVEGWSKPQGYVLATKMVVDKR